MNCGSDELSRCDVLRDFSTMLIELYRLATSADIVTFDRALFEIVRERISFDAAWFGRSTLTDAGPLMHTNCLFNLPAVYVDDWSRVKAYDPLVPKVRANPGKPATLCIVDDPLAPEFRPLIQQYALAQIICVGCEDLPVRLLTHMSIYRHGLLPRFGARERIFLEYTVPHIAAAIDLNRLHHIDSLKARESGPRLAVAICDLHHVIRYTDSNFASLIQLEWPDWRGGILPDALCAVPLRHGSAHYHGQHVTIELENHDSTMLIRAAARSSFDRLSPRERSVAKLFGEGMSYKEVARKLELSPATVRHHLRRVYGKLKIRDKGEIAMMLGQQMNGGAMPDATTGYRG